MMGHLHFVGLIVQAQTRDDKTYLWIYQGLSYDSYLPQQFEKMSGTAQVTP